MKSSQGSDPALYPDPNPLLRVLLSGARTVLGNHLVGLYVFGLVSLAPLRGPPPLCWDVIGDDA